MESDGHAERIGMSIRALIIFASVVAPAAMAESPDLIGQARAVFAANKAAVVTVELVIKEKMSMFGEASNESESKVSGTGTVISADGLTVMSLTSTDPNSMFANMMPSGMEEEFDMDSEVTDVKILLEDGTELPSEILLRDRDLDLAFVRPKEVPAAALAFVDLTAAAEVDILDAVVVIDRTGKVANRAHSVTVSRVSSLVSKPRRFYLTDYAQPSGGLGAPGFTPEGKLIGVFMLRMIRSTDQGGGFMSGLGGGMQDSMAIILLPAAEVLEGASQAPARGEAPVAEEAPAEETPAEETPATE